MTEIKSYAIETRIQKVLCVKFGKDVSHLIMDYVMSDFPNIYSINDYILDYLMPFSLIFSDDDGDGEEEDKRNCKRRYECNMEAEMFFYNHDGKFSITHQLGKFFMLIRTIGSYLDKIYCGRCQKFLKTNMAGTCIYCFCGNNKKDSKGKKVKSKVISTDPEYRMDQYYFRSLMLR